MTDAELTILSLLAQGSRYGHEIQTIIDERGMRDWLAIGYSSVYYLLNKFERQKMVVSEMRPGGVTSRKLYSLTEAGKGVLRTAVADLLRGPRPIGTGFELGLANLYVLKPAQVYQVLSYHKEDLETQLEAVRNLWGKLQPEQDIDSRYDLRALYTHSISRMEADLAWITTFLEEWVEQYPGVDENLIPLDDENEDDIHKARTKLHRRTPPNPLKMLQRLQRPSELEDHQDDD